MKTTMYKSQGRTFKEVHMEFNEDEYTTRDLGFVPDPFFTEHMKTLEGLQKKQRESGLEFDMEKVKAVVEEACYFGSDAPEGVRKAILDADQLWESFGPSLSSGKSCIDAMLCHRPDVHLVGEDPALIWFDEISQDGDKMFMEWLKRRKLEQVELQQLPKATVHDEFQFESVREYCQADMDLSKVEEISVEKAKQMVDKQRKVAIVGGGVIGASLAASLPGYRQGELCAIGHSFDTWNLNEFAAIAKVEKPARDWEQGKLRRGAGHNKLKRKGKK